MQNRFGQTQELSTQTQTQARSQNGGRPTTKEIPFDYVATFALEGRRGNRVQDVINISVEGAFVAVAIGYSFIPAQLPNLSDGDSQQRIAQIFNDVGNFAGNQLNSLNSFIAALSRQTATAFSPSALNTVPLRQWLGLLQPVVNPVALFQCLLVRLCGIDFRYSIVDSATGRELQNQPIHNIAGFGESSGERPFRPLPKPMVFQPRSTIRIEVEEISEGLVYGYEDTNGQRVGAELYIVLHGYKMLGVGI
jgi:hypothetical protein